MTRLSTVFRSSALVSRICRSAAVRVSSSKLGKELVQRWIEEPDDHRLVVHRPEQSGEVAPLERQEGGDRLPTFGGGRCGDHPLHDRKTVGGEEHVLGPAQSDALSTVGACPFGLDRIVGVGPDTQHTELVGPVENGGQPFVVDVGRGGGYLAQVHVSGGAIDRDPFAFVDLRRTDGEGSD